jgi:hypothetical protein
MSSKKSKHVNVAKVTSTPAVFVQEPVGAAEVSAQSANVMAKENIEVLETVATDSAYGVMDFQKKAMEFANQNMEQAFAFTRKLFAVKEFGDVVSLQQNFVAEQAQSFKAQASTLNEIALRVSAEATKPLTTSLEKSFQTFSKSFAA